MSGSVKVDECTFRQTMDVFHKNTRDGSLLRHIRRQIRSRMVELLHDSPSITCHNCFVAIRG